MTEQKRINKDRTFKFRCTEAELLLWKAKAKALGIPVAKLLADALNGINTKSKVEHKVQQKQVAEVAKIGNNLNQVARWVNTYKQGATVIDVLVVLKQIEQQIHILLISKYSDNTVVSGRTRGGENVE